MLDPFLELFIGLLYVSAEKEASQLFDCPVPYNGGTRFYRLHISLIYLEKAIKFHRQEKACRCCLGWAIPEEGGVLRDIKAQFRLELIEL